MDIKEIVNIISSNYSYLPPECSTDLEQSAKLLVLPKESTLVREGQFSDKVFFIVKGVARAFYNKDGKDVTDYFAFQNEFICAINSYFLDVASQHSIEVLEPSILLAINKRDAIVLSEKYRAFERLEKVIVTKTMLQLQQRVSSIQFETAQQKYENLLKLSPDIDQKVNLTHIASYLGITQETLSRIRNPKKRI